MKTLVLELIKLALVLAVIGAGTLALFVLAGEPVDPAARIPVLTWFGEKLGALLVIVGTARTYDLLGRWRILPIICQWTYDFSTSSSLEISEEEGDGETETAQGDGRE